MKAFGDLLEDHFHTHPYAEFSTTDLIKAIYPEEYDKIKAALHDPYSDKETKTIAKRHKGQLHRRLLYHLSRLEADGTILVTHIKHKGEKCYTLAQQRKHHAAEHLIPPAAHLQPFHHLEEYEQAGIIQSFDSRNWHNRLNAILLTITPEQHLNDLQARITKVSKFVNDVIGLHGTEHLLLKEDLTTIARFLKRLDIETRDNDKIINLLVDLTAVSTPKYLEDFIESFATMHPDNLMLTFTIDQHFIEHHQRLIKRLMTLFSAQTIKVNIHNKALHDAPIIMGKNGVYTLAPEDWQAHLAHAKDKTIGLCIGQVSIGLDLQRFFAKHPQEAALRSFLLKVARGLVEATTLQRRRADISFGELNKLNTEPHEFFRYATNYIRLWNYDWQEQDHPHLIELIGSCAEELERFSKTEENIFKSCGTPIRFNVALASMFSKAASTLSPRHYNKLTLTSLAALSDPKMQAFIDAREQLARHLRSNDRVRIFRSTPFHPDDVIKELLHLCKAHSIPILTYDFAARKTNKTLSEFL